MSMLASIIAQSRRRVTLDADALLYIAAVEATGVSMTSPQKTALSDFITAEKLASRFSTSVMWLPIWASASANAIELRTRASGTFSGTVTHSTGRIVGNGSSGYFNTGITPASVGMTTGTGLYFALIYAADTRGAGHSPFAVSAAAGGNPYCGLEANGTESIGFAHQIVGRLRHTDAQANHKGIYTVSRTATNAVEMRRRTTASAASLVTGTATTGAASSSSIFAMARNNGGSATNFSVSALGAFGMNLGQTSANTDAFTANLKTLWETCSGLTLP